MVFFVEEGLSKELAQPFEGEIVAFGEQKVYWDTFGFNVELQQVPCELRLSRAD